MVILKTQSEFGHAPPPQSPYAIISNLPGWDVAEAIRDGDKRILTRIVHIYPRLFPTQFSAMLGGAIAKYVGMEGKAAMVYLNPAMWPYTLRHVAHKNRGPHRLEPDGVTLKIIDIGNHRVYAVLFEPQTMPALILSWGAPGLGVSIRGSEELLRDASSMTEVSWAPGTEFPSPSWTPEGTAHQPLRERIIKLLHRSPIDPSKVLSSPSDVFLYPTGMAAIFHATNLMLEYRPGTIVVLGVVFHNTYHHLLEECPHGWKHHGKVDDQGIAEFETWLQEEKKAGRTTSYVFVEFPGNPTLDTPDLSRVKKLSETYGFVLIVDDTVSSFANVDLLPESDLLLTSLTKSFSGRADVMGGSIVLNPRSSHYDDLSEHFHSTHHNELFASDAEVLLANSDDYLERTAILNRNARAMADFLHAASQEPNSPIRTVMYPTLLPSKPLYDAALRPEDHELSEPGYGCLLNVDFTSIETARAFYNRCGFYPSPHLGGHVTMMLAYNLMVFGKKPEEREYMRSLGVSEEGIRISAGLEDEADLIDTLRDALDAAKSAE